MSVVILCIEDESEVREALVRDLAPFRSTFRIESAEDTADAKAVIHEALSRDDRIGLILCDHMLPGQRGVDFLIELHARPETHATRKVLLTGQAGLEDTVRAVNQAGLQHYIAKPWTPGDLESVVKTQLTEYVIGELDNLLPYVASLDSPKLLAAIAQRNRGS